MSLNKILLILHLEPLFHKIFLYLSFGSLSEIFLIKISHANPDNEENIEAGASYTCLKTNHAAKEIARETLSWSAHFSFKFLYVDEVIKQLHSYRKKKLFLVRLVTSVVQRKNSETPTRVEFRPQVFSIYFMVNCLKVNNKKY